MSQSTTTVTAPNPTPPTNLHSTGTTAPNPPNYTKNTYADANNWGSGTPTYPPPFYTAGSAGTGTTLATATAALASGSSTTAGGTEGTYPGASGGTVPASSSASPEGSGSETVSTLSVPNPSPFGQLSTVSVEGNYTTNPNGQHASSLSPSSAITLTSINPTSTAAAVGTITQTCTGTNFTSQSVMYVNGVAQTTTVVSSTSLTATVTKKTTAGTWAVMVRTAGIVETAPQTWTFT